MYPLCNRQRALVCGFWTELLNRKLAVVLLLCTVILLMPEISSTVHSCSLENAKCGKIWYSPFSYGTLSSLLGNATNKFVFWFYFLQSVLFQGPLKGRRVEGIQYEDISKLAWGAHYGSEEIWVPQTIFLASCGQTQETWLCQGFNFVCICIYNVYRE